MTESWGAVRPFYCLFVCEYVERSKTCWVAYMYGSLCECVFVQKVSVLKLPLNRGLDLSTTYAQEERLYFKVQSIERFCNFPLYQTGVLPLKTLSNVPWYSCFIQQEGRGQSSCADDWQVMERLKILLSADSVFLEVFFYKHRQTRGCLKKKSVFSFWKIKMGINISLFFHIKYWKQMFG